MPSRRSRGTSAFRQQKKQRRPRSSNRERLLPRIAVDARGVRLSDDQVNASVDVELDQTVDACLHPSQLLPLEMLRRPLELTQYVSIRYTERLAEAGVEPSVGSVGDSYDNALAETIFGLFKAEVIHPNGPWRSLEEVEFATLEWVDWFNNQRLLEPIGDIPPAEFEAMYYERHESPTAGVGLN